MAGTGALQSTEADVVSDNIIDDIYFTGALVTGASEDKDVTITLNKLRINAITISSRQNLNYRLWFYTRDTYLAADMIGYINLNLPTGGEPKVIGGTTYYMYNVVDANISYEDKDSNLKLHMQLENLSTTSKIAGVNGEVQITLVNGEI